MMRWNLEGETASEIYDRARKCFEPNLEMFIHDKDSLGQSGIATVQEDAFHSETTIRIQSDSLGDGGWGFFGADREKPHWIL